MNHTKGEWRVTKHRPLNSWVVDVNGDDLINRTTIAQCYDNEADAHLIAAAPDMYEALTAIKNDGKVEADFWKLRHKALAKAGGKA